MAHSIIRKKYNIAQVRFKRDTGLVRYVNKNTGEAKIMDAKKCDLLITRNYPTSDKMKMYDFVFDNFKMNYSLVENIFIGYSSNKDPM